MSLLLASTGVYAFESDNVLPDTPLYPVRLAIEQAAERVTTLKPEWRAEMQVKILQRRLKERQIMNEKGKPVTPEQVQRFVTKVEATIDSADTLTDVQRERLDTIAATAEQHYAEALIQEREKARTNPRRRPSTTSSRRKQEA